MQQSHIFTIFKNVCYIFFLFTKVLNSERQLVDKKIIPQISRTFIHLISFWMRENDLKLMINKSCTIGLKKIRLLKPNIFFSL